MAAILAGGNVEEEYLWSCSLSGSNKEYSWDPVKLEPEQKAGDNKELKEDEVRLPDGGEFGVPAAKLEVIKIMEETDE